MDRFIVLEQRQGVSCGQKMRINVQCMTSYLLAVAHLIEGCKTPY